MTNEPTLWEQFLLDPMTYIYWGVAIISSLVFTIQTLLLFVGFDADGNFDGEMFLSTWMASHLFLSKL